MFVDSQLAEQPDQQEDRPHEDEVLGREREPVEPLGAPHLRVVAHHVRRLRGVGGERLVDEQPAEDRLVALEERLRQRRVGRQRPELGDDVEQRLRVALVGRARRGDQLADVGVGEPLREPEVDERDAAVGEEEVVARVRVAVQQPVAERAVDVEADEDLADPVALGLRQLLRRGEPGAVDELADQDALARQRRCRPRGRR